MFDMVFCGGMKFRGRMLNAAAWYSELPHSQLKREVATLASTDCTTLHVALQTWHDCRTYTVRVPPCCYSTSYTYMDPNLSLIVINPNLGELVQWLERCYSKVGSGSSSSGSGIGIGSSGGVGELWAEG